MESDKVVKVKDSGGMEPPEQGQDLDWSVSGKEKGVEAKLISKDEYREIAEAIGNDGQEDQDGSIVVDYNEEAEDDFGEDEDHPSQVASSEEEEPDLPVKTTVLQSGVMLQTGDVAQPLAVKPGGVPDMSPSSNVRRTENQTGYSGAQSNSAQDRLRAEHENVLQPATQYDSAQSEMSAVQEKKLERADVSDATQIYLKGDKDQEWRESIAAFANETFDSTPDVSPGDENKYYESSSFVSCMEKITPAEGAAADLEMTSGISGSEALAAKIEALMEGQGLMEVTTEDARSVFGPMDAGNVEQPQTFKKDFLRKAKPIVMDASCLSLTKVEQQLTIGMVRFPEVPGEEESDRAKRAKVRENLGTQEMDEVVEQTAQSVREVLSSAQQLGKDVKMILTPDAARQLGADEDLLEAIYRKRREIDVLGRWVRGEDISKEVDAVCMPIGTDSTETILATLEKEMVRNLFSIS
jgi:hypothetical protein